MRVDSGHLDDATMRARVEALQWTVAKDLLTAGATVVLEWGTWSRAERDKLREQARAVGASVELRFLDAPAEELWRRIAGRAAEDPPIRRQDLDEWIAVFSKARAGRARAVRRHRLTDSECGDSAVSTDFRSASNPVRTTRPRTAHLRRRSGGLQSRAGDG